MVNEDGLAADGGHELPDGHGDEPWGAAGLDAPSLGQLPDAGPEEHVGRRPTDSWPVSGATLRGVGGWLWSAVGLQQQAAVPLLRRRRTAITPNPTIPKPRP